MALTDGQSDAPAQFPCPRCGTAAAERWYGPCASCRHALRASIRATPVDAAADAYEPKANVTPNAVAIKD